MSKRRVQERFDAAVKSIAIDVELIVLGYEYDIDARADVLRIARDGAVYSWAELPDHVRDYWREAAECDPETTP